MTTHDEAPPRPPQLYLFEPPSAANDTTLIASSVVELGRLFATPDALVCLQRLGVPAGALIGRHQFGDPGELDTDDIAANFAARRYGGRVLSWFAYGPEREAIWVITEADRSATTILLPSDY